MSYHGDYNRAPPPPPPPLAIRNTDADGNDTFVTYAQGKLKLFNQTKNFGFISPVWRPENAEGPPLSIPSEDGFWFFGNHSLRSTTQPGVVLSFEVWENSEGKPQARGVRLDPSAAALAEEQLSRRSDETQVAIARRHPNEPRVIYPSVYLSDVPVEYSEETLRELHSKMALNPETIVGLKFLPFTEASLGKSSGERVVPLTGAVILRYINEEAANAAVDRLKGHPIRTNSGVVKYLGARHAAPAKWMMERKVVEEQAPKPPPKEVQSLLQKIRGYVCRVSAAGYGVIKNEEWGEVMWRQYELPTNLRTLQFADPEKFQQEVHCRSDYVRLKEMDGKEVEAELYRMPDGQLRASHVKVLNDVADQPLHVSNGQPSSAPSSASRQLPSQPSPQYPLDGLVVCVRPVPRNWSSTELRERFDWYGQLAEAMVERRIYDVSAAYSNGNRRLPPPQDGSNVWSLGVLYFNSMHNAEQVMRRENGGSLDGCAAVSLEQGVKRKDLGWCKGKVQLYLPAYYVGLIRSDQIQGDIHFEATPEMRAQGSHVLGMDVDARVVISGDCCLQAAEVRFSGQAASNAAPPDAGPMVGGNAWGPQGPFFKTQPCPYHMQGMCQMGQSCHFAHSPDELRPVPPEAMMMNPYAMMMGMGKEKKKKDKKEKKDKRAKDKIHVREASEPRSDSGGEAMPPRELEGPGRYVIDSGEHAGNQPRDRPPRKRHRRELDDADF